MTAIPRALRAFALTFCLLSGAASAQNVVFLSNGLTQGGSPWATATADFNGDGALDLAVTNSSSDDVRILLGDGWGGFASALPLDEGLPVGIQPVATAVGDLNGDGKQDLAVANFFTSNVSTLLGKGTGSFFAATHFATGVGPSDLVLGDTDGDGKLDAVTTSIQGVSLLTGDGTGKLGRATHFLAGTSMHALVAADLNGDGRADVIVARELASANVALLLGVGIGGFGAPTDLATGLTDVLSLALGDVNADGRLDLIAGGLKAANSGYSVMLGNGPGTFATATSTGLASFPEGGFTRTNLAELNLDGKLDAAFASVLSGLFSAWTGDGLGTFAGPKGVICSTNGYASAGAAATGDFNADGRIDFATALASSEVVALNAWPLPAGIGQYGTGTQGCDGRHGISANIAPKVNTPGFEVLTTQAESNSIGGLLVADTQDLAGSDPLGLGVTLHIGLLTASQLLGFTFTNDTALTSRANVPIPNTPALVGMSFYAQGLFAKPPCLPATGSLSSSKGLKITIQP